VSERVRRESREREEREWRVEDSEIILEKEEVVRE